MSYDLPKKLPKIAHITRALYLRLPQGANLDFVAHGMAAVLEGPVHLFRLEGPDVAPGQGEQILTPLFLGETVVLSVEGRSELLCRLVEQWERYVEHPAGTDVTITRNLSIPPRKDLQKPGLLIGVQVSSEDVRSPDVGIVNYLGEDEVRAFVSLRDRSTLEVRTVGVGQPALGLTLKDLCLLHARDAHPGDPALSMPDVLNGSGSITWTELEIMLHLSRGERGFFDSFKQAGRLDQEKYAVALAAFELLDSLAERGPRGMGTAVYSSIYDVVWNYHRLGRASYLFRGQRDARWRQVASLLRPSNGSPLDVQTLLGRVAQTEMFLAALRKDQYRLLGTILDEDGLLAVAQHYGFATPLMDYTSSFGVAAFFATHGVTPKTRDLSQDIGVIYYFDRNRREIGGDGATLSEQIGIDKFRLLPAARIRLGDVRWIEPRLPASEDRISRQHGLFVYGFESRDFQRIGIDRLLFRQTGEVFEDPRRGISTEQLLPDDSKLAELAMHIKENFQKSKQHVHARVGDTFLPEDQAIGSEGISLFAQIRESRKFFSLLCKGAPAEETTELAGIFQEYFDLCLASADADFAGAEAPGAENETQGLDPLNVVLNRLSRFSGIEVGVIWRSFMPLHPDLFERQESQEVLMRDCVPPAELRSRLAYATILYVLSWEHLRMVHGQTARALMQQAQLLLHLSGN